MLSCFVCFTNQIKVVSTYAYSVSQKGPNVTGRFGELLQNMARPARLLVLCGK